MRHRGAPGHDAAHDYKLEFQPGSTMEPGTPDALMTDALTTLTGITPVESTMEHSSSPSWEQLPDSSARKLEAHDRRRLGMRMSTSCSAVLQANGRASHCRAVQMSTTGLILSGGASLPPGQQATLHIYLDARRPVSLKVKAVRTIGPLQAFEFVDLRDADRLALAEFFDRRVAH